MHSLEHTCFFTVPPNKPQQSPRPSSTALWQCTHEHASSLYHPTNHSPARRDLHMLPLGALYNQQKTLPKPSTTIVAVVWPRQSYGQASSLFNQTNHSKPCSMRPAFAALGGCMQSNKRHVFCYCPSHPQQQWQSCGKDSRMGKLPPCSTKQTTANPARGDLHLLP
jgi:hypothetical protein